MPVDKIQIKAEGITTSYEGLHGKYYRCCEDLVMGRPLGMDLTALTELQNCTVLS